jgi:hypothetical protein
MNSKIRTSGTPMNKLQRMKTIASVSNHDKINGQPINLLLEKKPEIKKPTSKTEEQRYSSLPSIAAGSS